MIMANDGKCGILRGWAKAYRECAEHRFPSDPHAEFFPVDMDAAADRIEALEAECNRWAEKADTTAASLRGRVAALRERMWCRACGTVTADETCDCNRYGQTICEPSFVNYADAMQKSAHELAQENATLTARVVALEAARCSQRSQHRQMRDAINDVELALNELEIDSLTRLFETADDAVMVKVPLGALRRLARCYPTLNRIINDPAFETKET